MLIVSYFRALKENTNIETCVFRRYKILQLLQIRNENALTKRTVSSPNSASTKRQLTY